MKTIRTSALILFMLMGIKSNLFSTDRIVREFGAGGAYSTITDAYNASVDGDRIIIKPKAGGADYGESITIAKSLQFLCENEGGRFEVTGTWAITAAALRTVNIIGIELTGSINSSGGVTGNLMETSIFNSVITGNLNFGYDNNKLIVAATTLTGFIYMRKGSLYGNTISTSTATYLIQVTAETSPMSNDTVSIIGNRLSNSLGASYVIYSSSNDHAHIIMNNFIQYSYMGIYVSSWLTGSYSHITNNTLQNVSSTASDYGIYLSSLPASTDVQILNNVLDMIGTTGTQAGIYGTGIIGTSNVSYNHFETGINTAIFGFVDDGSNVNPSTFTVTGTGEVTTGNPVNGGHPDSTHYDIDLTRNNCGAYGGSFTMNNFFPTTDLNARVYYIDIPRRVIIGGNMNVKAESFDK